MIRTTKLMFFAVTIFGFVAAALAPTSAFAQDTDFRKYQSDSKGLIQIVDAWTVEVEQELLVIAAKPEMARSESVLTLIRRGHGMAADMRGTAENAPNALRAKHDAATDGLVKIVEGLGVISDGGNAVAIEHGVKHVGEGLSDYSRAIRPVRYFASRAR